MRTRIGVVAIAAIVGTALMSTHDSKGANDEQQISGEQAARSLLQALPENKRTQAQLPFESGERTEWNYVPMKRAGVPLADLDANQKALVDSLLRSALSPQGLDTAKGIVQHELILREIEGNAQRRDPGLYYTVVFGEPGPRAPWAWRFEGHHLSVNATNVEGQRQIVAPLFMGSNPARVASGPKAGLRLLAAEEDLARALIQMLPRERRARATLSEDAFSDIVTRNDPKVRSLEVEGLAASDMTGPEQEQLRKLLHVYANRNSSASSAPASASCISAGPAVSNPASLTTTDCTARPCSSSTTTHKTTPITSTPCGATWSATSVATCFARTTSSIAAPALKRTIIDCAISRSAAPGSRHRWSPS
jgi:hypothetical protein